MHPLLYCILLCYETLYTLQLYKFVMGCLFISEIVMTVYFGIKKGKAQAPLSIIPLLLTALFYHKVNNTFIKPSRILALERAREVDDAVKVCNCHCNCYVTDSNRFVTVFNCYCYHCCAV
jgi:hypothetical protein